MAAATVDLRPVNDSGVQGVMTLVDDGVTVTVNGIASGLDPGNAAGYGSATYDLASPVQGPEACEPGRRVGVGTDHPLSLTLDQMTIGSFFLEPVWAVDAQGDGTLVNETLLEYVSIDRIGTVSIRDRSIAGPFGPGTGPAAVVACGRVAR